VHLLLPVPLHPSRLSERGFNQSLEIARWSARRLCLPLAPGLAVRVRATAPQAGLSSGDRRANLRDAFLAGTAVRGLNIGLVDDVVTTGSTVTALSAALLDAGAASVSVFCVARAVESAQGQPTPSGAGVRLVAPKDRPGCA
jgi:ComF family protein